MLFVSDMKDCGIPKGQSFTEHISARIVVSLPDEIFKRFLTKLVLTKQITNTSVPMLLSYRHKSTRARWTSGFLLSSTLGVCQ